MRIMTIEEEAEALRERFQGVNRAAFARDHQVRGGQAMIYQHITGRRPINIEAAMAYAAGFKCSLEEISPRLAVEAQKAAALSSEQPTASISPVAPWPFTSISEAQVRALPPAKLNALEGALALAIAQLNLGIEVAPPRAPGPTPTRGSVVDIDAAADEFPMDIPGLPGPRETNAAETASVPRKAPLVSGAVDNIQPAAPYPANDEMVDVPELGEVRLAANIEGHENEAEHQTGVMQFRKSFLQSVGAEGGRGRVVYAKGDSMEPIIADGSALLVVLDEHLTVRDLAVGGIYAIRYDGKTMVKKVVKDKLTGHWVARSFNETYGDVSLENGVPVRVLGRVVWAGTKLA